jgi:hypothetical protein
MKTGFLKGYRASETRFYFGAWLCGVLDLTAGPTLLVRGLLDQLLDPVPVALDQLALVGPEER